MTRQTKAERAMRRALQLVMTAVWGVIFTRVKTDGTWVSIISGFYPDSSGLRVVNCQLSKYLSQWQRSEGTDEVAHFDRCFGFIHLHWQAIESALSGLLEVSGEKKRIEALLKKVDKLKAITELLAKGIDHRETREKLATNLGDGQLDLLTELRELLEKLDPVLSAQLEQLEYDDDGPEMDPDDDDGDENEAMG